jgi:uncharacterized protein (DUF58 family)
MAIKKLLNVDVPKAITDFEEAAKEFELKEKIYRIIFRGKGLEFDKYRDFSPDEDSSSIDWKASLRSNKLIAKQFIEERDLKIIFMVDVSENMLFGSAKKLKCEYAAELISALSYMIVGSGDNIGYVLYSNQIKKFAPPKKGKKQFNIFVEELSDPDNYGGGSNFEVAIDFLLNYLKNIDAVFFISDFIGLKEHIYKELSLASHKFETISIMIKDELDKTLPNVNREIVVEDPVSGEQILINPKKIREVYERRAYEAELKVKGIFKKANVDLFELSTKNSFAFPLAGFLKERVVSGRKAAV